MTLQKHNQRHKPLARQMKKREANISSAGNKKWGVTLGGVKIKKTEEYHEQFNAKKFENILNEQIPRKRNLTKLT